MYKYVAVVLLWVFALPAAAIDPFQDDDNPDPFEDVNRLVFAFNDSLDQMILKPVAKGYQRVTPDVAERGIGNFFANLSEFNSAVNSLLQGKPDAFFASGGRFLVNSTLGIAGLFDVATPMGMESRETDLGETLAVWGVPRGPYLMVPFFGPRTVRSGIGSIGDIYLSPEAYIDSTRGRNGLYGLRVVDERAELLDADALLSGDRYIFLRDAYLQRRSARIESETVDPEDVFSDFDEDWLDDDFEEDPR